MKKKSTVTLQTRNAFLLKALLDAFKATGKCNMELGKAELFVIQSGWALMKKSLNTLYINNG